MAHSPALDRLWRWLRGNTPPGGTPPAPPKTAGSSHASASGLRQQRGLRREQLFALVRENMIRLGVLSSHYKFKVLTLDPGGDQFIVMVDWQPGAPMGDAGFEKSYESGLQHLLDERRLGFRVKAVYWRGAVVGGVAVPPVSHPVAVPAPAPAQAPPPPAAARPVAPAPSASRSEHVSDDELLAFQAALREAGGGSRAAPAGQRPPPLAPEDMPDFEPTINTEDKAGTEFGSLSETQYGKLH